MAALENLIAFFSPRAALKRKAAVVALEQMRKYDAASYGRRTANWRAPSTSSSAETQISLQTLRNRSRDMCRNNAWAKKAQTVVTTNTIGHGIRGTVRGRSNAQAANMQALWNSWAESTQCDADGMHNLYGLQELCMNTIFESGEVLIQQVFNRSLRVPFQLKVLEPDHLDTTRDGSIQGGRILEGIEYNDAGRIVAYWLYPQHPGDRLQYRDNYLASVRVPAENIIHIYKKTRPGQVRGTPWMTNVMLRLKDLDEYEDAQLVRQKIAACFAGFIRDMDGTNTINDQPIISDKIEPGSLEVLPAGRDITFASPPPMVGYSEYMRNLLHSIAAGMGITYESLTGDLSQVNFSSGRMGWLEFNRNIEAWRWTMFIPQGLDRIWGWFVQAAEIQGFDAQRFEVEWTAPRREMIDPSKEISAMRDAIRSGLCTLSEAQRMLGFDPDKMIAEYKKDNEKLDANGLVFDSDPRKTSQQGQIQPNDQPDEPDAPPSDADRALDTAILRLVDGIVA